VIGSGGLVLFCTTLYNIVMKVTMTEARQKLPELVRRVRNDSELRVQITVHGEVAAELHACLPEPRPGAAASRLREVMAQLPAHRGPERRVSESVNEHLYGKASE
jgi:antitoxin (DNA-binding transcriptional repressor) of toxin-antitoxin stability system